MQLPLLVPVFVEAFRLDHQHLADPRVRPALEPNQLVGLNFAARRGTVPPDEVMEIWLHAIFDARIVAAQSEASFIDAARSKQHRALVAELVHEPRVDARVSISPHESHGGAPTGRCAS